MSESQSNEVAEQPDRPLVVVGVSQTSHSPVALRWAADYSEVIGANLLAVRAWRPSHPPSAASGRPAVVSRDVTGERDHAQAALYDDVSRAIGDEHARHAEIREGTPLSVLTALSGIAALLVIDAPRRTDLSTTPMLAHRLVYNASCPVVVMPPRISQQPDSPLVTAGKWLARGFVESAGTAGRPGIRPPSRSTGDNAPEQGASPE